MKNTHDKSVHISICSCFLVYAAIIKEWYDIKLKWEPKEYGGVTRLYVPSTEIWLPDIVLYNK